MHAILTGSAKIAKVCVWAEKNFKGEIETAEGRRVFNGKADFVAGIPDEALSADGKFSCVPESLINHILSVEATAQHW